MTNALGVGRQILVSGSTHRAAGSRERYRGRSGPTAASGVSTGRRPPGRGEGAEEPGTVAGGAGGVGGPGGENGVPVAGPDLSKSPALEVEGPELT